MPSPSTSTSSGPTAPAANGDRIIEVSNNNYQLTSFSGFGTRARLDAGELGVTAAELRGAWDIARFLAAQWLRRLDRFGGWTHWATTTFTVESGSPVEAAVDGEAMVLDPPLVFRILPGVLRVRLPPTAPGYSPAALKAPSPWWTPLRLRRGRGRSPDGDRRAAALGRSSDTRHRERYGSRVARHGAELLEDGELVPVLTQRADPVTEELGDRDPCNATRRPDDSMVTPSARTIGPPWVISTVHSTQA